MKNGWLLRACPQCSGDLYRAPDEVNYGCLNCARTWHLNVMTRTLEPPQPLPLLPGARDQYRRYFDTERISA